MRTKNSGVFHIKYVGTVEGFKNYLRFMRFYCKRKGSPMTLVQYCKSHTEVKILG